MAIHRKYSAMKKKRLFVQNHAVPFCTVNIFALVLAGNAHKGDFMNSAERIANEYWSVVIFARINVTTAHHAQIDAKIVVFIASVENDVESYVYHVWNDVAGDASIIDATSSAMSLVTDQGVMNHAESVCPVITCVLVCVESLVQQTVVCATKKRSQ